MFRKAVKHLFLGFVLCLLILVGIEQSAAIVAPLPKAEAISLGNIQTLPDSPSLESAVDRFLTSIPAGYYTIANVEGLKNQLKKPQTLLVDVREPAEFRAGHIPNAINLPLRTLAHNLDQVPRDRLVVLYCSSGYRSAMGVMTLHLLGYGNVQGFPPSFVGWQTAGEAIAKP